MQRSGPSAKSAKLSAKIKTIFGIALKASLFVLCAVLSFYALGCRRQGSAIITPGQVRQITQELAKAASDATPSGTTIKIRHTRKALGGTLSGGKLSAAIPADDLYIGLRNAGPNADPTSTAKLLQSLEGIATRHRLTLDPATRTATTTRITLRSAGVATHSIQIEILNSRASAKGDAPPGHGWRFYWTIWEATAPRPMPFSRYGFRSLCRFCPTTRTRKRLLNKRESTAVK